MLVEHKQLICKKVILNAGEIQMERVDVDKCSRITFVHKTILKNILRDFEITKKISD